jgi:hypothetical protein
MRRQGVIRTLADGGCSVCYASEENVGKRRCRHVLDSAELKVEKEKGSMFVNIDAEIDGKEEKFSIKAEEDKIKDFISNLSNGLSKKQKEKILEDLRG